MSQISSHHPTFALEPVCDACHCSQADHATELDRIESMDEFPPEEGAAVSTCTDCNDCYVEPPFTGHAGIAAYHPQIEQEMFRLRRLESSIRHLNGCAHIAQSLVDSIPQDGRIVLHAGNSDHPAFVAIHIPVMGDSLPEGERTYAQTRAVYSELDQRGFMHDRSHDFQNPQDGSIRARYVHSATAYKLEIVIYQESDPETHPPFTADQVNEIRANFWQQLSGTGASS
jgi:hypothetical protein